jgi:hypothetical protein
MIYSLLFSSSSIIFVTFYVANKYFVSSLVDISGFVFHILLPGALVIRAVGWILVLILKKRPLPHSGGSNSAIKPLNPWIARSNFLLSKIFVPFPKLKYLVHCLIIVFILIMGSLAGNSTVGRDSRYVTYSNTINSVHPNSTFSFEYPRYFDLSSSNQVKSKKVIGVEMDELYLPRYKFFLFQEGFDQFSSITVIPSGMEDSYWGFNFNSKMNTLKKALTQYSGRKRSQNNSDLMIKTENPVPDVNDIYIFKNQPITISGIKADYIVLGEREQYSHLWSVFRFVYFKHNNLSYVLTMEENNSGMNRILTTLSRPSKSPKISYV